MARKRGERFWWAVLVRANEQMTTECCRRPPDMDEWHLAHNVGLRARGELVKLGLNLDHVFPPADEEFLCMMRGERRRVADEVAARNDGLRLLDEVDALLKKHGT